MKTTLHYSSVKPVNPVKVWKVRLFAAISYFLFAAMLFAMAFGKDLLNVFK
jgi:hypothetical protein